MALTAIVETSNISPETTSALLQHVSRLETLILEHSEVTKLPILQKIFDGVALAPAPILGRLQIHRYCYWDTYSFSGYANVILPKAAFVDAVRLRELSLLFIDVDWDCHLLSSLNSLSLRNISDARKPTPAQFRSMMERNPDLEGLMLENAFPSSRGLVGTSKFTSEPILLCHLETVTLELTLPQLKYFSTTVAFPPSIRSISVALVHTDGYELGSLLSDMLYRYPWSQIRSVLVDFERTGSEQFVRFLTSTTLASWQEVSSAYENEDATLSIQLTARPVFSTATLDIYDIDRDWDLIDTTMEQLFKSLRWSNLAELVCSRAFNDLMPEDVTWATTFGTLRGLHTVVADVDLAETLISAFQIGLRTHDPPGNKPKFRGLRHFEIRGYGPTIYFRVDVAKLRECLLIRKEYGLELTSLKLVNCTGTWIQDVAELKGLVGKIEHPSFGFDENPWCGEM